MRFFTYRWWMDDYDPSSVFEEAHRYFGTIASQLPATIREFVAQVSLHDAHLVHLVSDATAATVQLDLEELFWDQSRNLGDRRPLRILYSGVAALEILREPVARRTIYYGDLGYDEFDLASDGLFEHRMLFASGTELRVRFAEFSFSHE